MAEMTKVVMLGKEYSFPASMSREEIGTALQQLHDTNKEKVYESYSTRPGASLDDQAMNVIRKGTSALDKFLAEKSTADASPGIMGRFAESPTDIAERNARYDQLKAGLSGVKRGIGSIAEGSGELIGNIIDPLLNTNINTQIANAESGAESAYNANPNVQEYPTTAMIGRVLPAFAYGGSPNLMGNIARGGIYGASNADSSAVQGAAEFGLGHAVLSGVPKAIRGLSGVIDDMNIPEGSKAKAGIISAGARMGNTIEDFWDANLPNTLRPNKPMKQLVKSIPGFEKGVARNAGMKFDETMADSVKKEASDLFDRNYSGTEATSFDDMMGKVFDPQTTMFSYGSMDAFTKPASQGELTANLLRKTSGSDLGNAMIEGMLPGSKTTNKVKDAFVNEAVDIRKKEFVDNYVGGVMENPRTLFEGLDPNGPILKHLNKFPGVKAARSAMGSRLPPDLIASYGQPFENPMYSKSEQAVEVGTLVDKIMRSGRGLKEGDPSSERLFKIIGDKDGQEAKRFILDQISKGIKPNISQDKKRFLKDLIGTIDSIGVKRADLRFDDPKFRGIANTLAAQDRLGGKVANDQYSAGRERFLESALGDLLGRKASTEIPSGLKRGQKPYPMEELMRNMDSYVPRQDEGINILTKYLTPGSTMIEK